MNELEQLIYDTPNNMRNSESIQGELEPTRDMIRQELYKIIKDEQPLSYTEVRGKSV